MNNSDNLIVNKINDILKDKMTLANLYHNENMRKLCHSFFTNLYTVCLFDNHVRVLNLCTCFYLYLNEENRLYKEKTNQILLILDSFRTKNPTKTKFRDNLYLASIYDSESADKLIKLLNK